ncbi:MAG: LysM peptidoglycan-binding domain-containing protein [Gemmatimonadetes bacterium]|nr:LysM peptidoglycan-binding domain-containing protein [Gemmatimonadota bacterium]
MRLYCCIIALLFMACAHGKSTGPLVFDETTTLVMPTVVDPPPDMADLRAVRWHLLFAIESHALGQTQRAQEALDAARGILADLDEHDALVDTAQAATLESAIEQAYLDLLPHLKDFPDNSRLLLLSEEKIEHLPADAKLSVRIRQLGPRCDMPIDDNDRVVAKLRFFQTRGRKTFAIWLQRAGRYRTLIGDILRREEMPSDLFYVAVIESGLNPRAYSRSRAVGLWQFMARTGRMMDLKLTHWIDERRDPIKATEAAARYLKDLFAEFGDWRLALAAYNGGPGRVRRAIARAGTNDYWQLDLPRETKNYVPLFMAATVIAKDPQLFGFKPQAEEPAFAYEKVVLPEDWPYVDLKAAAQLLGIERQVLHDLNPELRQDITPPGSRSAYTLRVPPGKGRLLLDRYASLPTPQKAAVHQYRVQRGDTISDIAQTFGVTTRVITAANSLRNPNLIRPRQLLYIPISAAPATKQASGIRGTYTVRPNDSLSLIASQHGVSLRNLMKWNGLKTTLIKPGQKLVVRQQPIPREVPSGETYTVQPGDTLWELARRFAVSVADLQAWNGLEKALIKPGQQLTVASEQARLYTVVTGDTLHSIARKFGLAPSDIARQNNIGLSETLLAGTTLQIPR